MHPKCSCLFFSAVIITHLCTASTFFTLLSWLPTFFKDTFPDAKVNWTTFCENTICVEAKEYQCVYWDFSPSMWEKQSLRELIPERASHVRWCCCGWAPAGGSTSRRIRVCVWFLFAKVFIGCSCVRLCVCLTIRLHVCFLRVGCLTWSHGLWPSLLPCLVAAFQTI